MTEALHIQGYKIDRLLAKGGMSEVYLAEQLSLGRKVAIKVMDTHASDHEFAERFLHEARLVAALNHSNLITIYDFGQLAGGKLFLSMEYLQGGDLEERLSGGVTEKVALRIVRSLADVLRFVHSKGIIHRDIKPANILVREDETLVLTDFGIAKKISNDVGLTQAGMIVGSAAYGSPEQMQGLELNTPTDMYSVGVLFTEMLTGKNPFKADSFVNTAMNHIQMSIPRLQGEQARFQPLLDKMLAKKPKDRFASMDALIAALDATATVTASSPIPVAHTPRPQPRPNPTDRANVAPSPSSTSPSRTQPAAQSVTPSSSNRVASPPTEPSPSVRVSIKTNSLNTFGNNGPDDFFEEAQKLLASEDISLTQLAPLVTNKPKPPPKTIEPRSTPAAKPIPEKHASPKNSRNTGSDRYSGHFNGVRNRPLPSNLLDDE